MARHGEFAIAALLGREIDNYAAVLHRFDHAGGDELGCRLARNQRRGDDDIDFHTLLGDRFALCFLKPFAHDLRIATGTAAFFLIIHADEFCPEALNLILDLRPGVHRTHDRAESVGCANRSQTSDTSTNDEYLGGRHLAGCRDLPREEATEILRGFDNRAVARDIRHRTQGIELLRARNSRHAVHREDGHAPRR